MKRNIIKWIPGFITLVALLGFIIYIAVSIVNGISNGSHSSDATIFEKYSFLSWILFPPIILYGFYVLLKRSHNKSEIEETQPTKKGISFKSVFSQFSSVTKTVKSTKKLPSVLATLGIILVVGLWYLQILSFAQMIIAFIVAIAAALVIGNIWDWDKKDPSRKTVFAITLFIVVCGFMTFKSENLTTTNKAQQTKAAQPTQQKASRVHWKSVGTIQKNGGESRVIEIPSGEKIWYKSPDGNYGLSEIDARPNSYRNRKKNKQTGSTRTTAVKLKNNDTIDKEIQYCTLPIGTRP